MSNHSLSWLDRFKDMYLINRTWYHGFWMDKSIQYLMSKRNKIFIQWISLQMLWTLVWFSVIKFSSYRHPSQVGNLSQQSELRLHWYPYHQSIQWYALESHMLCFQHQSLEDEHGFLKHQIFGSFIDLIVTKVKRKANYINIVNSQ
jgi:hypothetical protein